MPTIENNGHIDIDDIAVDQRPIPRNAMADHVIDRGAGGFGIAAIAQRRRCRAMRQGEVMAKLVQLPGGDAGQDMRADHIEAGRGQLPGAAHAQEIFGLV